MFFVGLLVLLPLLGWWWLVPSSLWGKRWHRMLFWSVAAVASFTTAFLLFVEYFFFEEFKSRFNTVAVDYLLYPHEVFVNIWESYHVGIVLVACVLFAGGWTWTASKLFKRMFAEVLPMRQRFALIAGVCVVVFIMASLFNLKISRVSTNRTLNEMANNGAISFFFSAWTHQLDYGAFYKTTTLDEAYSRVRRILAEPHTTFIADGHSIQRKVEGDSSKPKLNVVLILDESLGSEFWGCLGRTTTLTPEMDKLAGNEGLLFTEPICFRQPNCAGYRRSVNRRFRLCRETRS